MILLYQACGNVSIFISWINNVQLTSYISLVPVQFKNVCGIMNGIIDTGILTRNYVSIPNLNKPLLTNSSYELVEAVKEKLNENLY